MLKESKLEEILDEISKIYSQKGLTFVTALLLNKLNKKEMEVSLRKSINNNADDCYWIDLFLRSISFTRQ
ncbi:MAG: hypothetical protein N2746_08870 [Deltaproteobacteria bacterium]|nr:hypothetical protein [Deltaproteobacteria bacterium]